MKTLNKISILIVFTLIWSCTKNDYQTGKIINDCSGVYFRMNNDDYLICNNSMVRDLETGTEIKIKYQVIDECEKQNNPPCYLPFFHEYKSIILISKIKS